MKLFNSIIKISECHTFSHSMRHVNSIVKKTKVPSETSKSFCIPNVPDSKIAEIRSILGLNIGLTFISWTRIEVENNYLTDLDFVMFPDNFNRMDLNDIYHLALKIEARLPKADRYILEIIPKYFPGIKGNLQLSLQASRMQITATILTLLNIHSNTKDSSVVIFLKQRLAAKLFGLLMGNEIMSCRSIVNELLKSNNWNGKTSIIPVSDIVTKFSEADSVHQEIMGRALLDTLTFLELVLHKKMLS